MQNNRNDLNQQGFFFSVKQERVKRKHYNDAPGQNISFLVVHIVEWCLLSATSFLLCLLLIIFFKQAAVPSYLRFTRFTYQSTGLLLWSKHCSPMVVPIHRQYATQTHKEILIAAMLSQEVHVFQEIRNYKRYLSWMSTS